MSECVYTRAECHHQGTKCSECPLTDLVCDEFTDCLDLSYEQGRADEQLRSIESAKEQAKEYRVALEKAKADGFQEALTSNGINIYVDKIETDGARKFAEKIKSDIEKYWYQSELDMGAENVNSLIDDALAEWQKEQTE